MPINIQYSGSGPNPLASRWTETASPRFLRGIAGATLRSPSHAAALAEIQLSADELAHLHQLLTQELAGSRLELSHRVSLPERDNIRHHMEQQEALLKKLHAALPAASGTRMSA